MNQASVTYRDPRELTISPLLARIPMLDNVLGDEAAAEYQAGLLSTRQTGKIRVPVKLIAGTNQIADGRHRQKWAIDCELAEIPTEEITEEEALSVIRQEIFARRSMTRGQKAWLHLVLVPGVADGKSGPKKAGSNSDIECPNSLQDLADAAGVSRSLMKEAAALFRLFTTGKAFTTGKNADEARQALEDRIWAGEGLGQILGDLKEAPNSKKPPADKVEPDPDVLSHAAAEKYTHLLAEWDTELHAAKSYAHLTNAAIHETSAKLGSMTRTLTLAAMARPDLPPPHKAQLLAEAREHLADLTAAAQAAGIKI